MRIIVRYCLPWGNFSTQPIDIDPNWTLEFLKQKICDRFSIPRNLLLLKMSRDDFYIRIVDNFPLEFYEIKEKTIFFAEKIESKNEGSEKKRITSNYLVKLGLLNTIKEEHSENYSGKHRSSDAGSQGSFSHYSESDDEHHHQIMARDSLSPIASPLLREEGGKKFIFTKFFDEKKYLEGELENLLKHTRSDEKDKVIQILDSTPEDLSNTAKQKVKDKKKLLFEQLGGGGWNALHFSIFSLHNDIVKEFISRGADCTKLTLEGWSPLQLAVYKDNFEVFKILLERENVNVNEFTAKGTALSIAVKYDRPKFVPLLLDKGAKTDITLEDGTTIFDLCNNKEIEQIISDHMQRTKSNSTPNSLSTPEDDLPPRPPVVKGKIMKQGNIILTPRERFCILDPVEGTFIRYKKESDYPFKPLEILPLKDILRIELPGKSWYMSGELFYFEVIYSGKQVLACKSERIRDIWINLLKKGIQYAKILDEKYKSNQDLMSIADLNNKETNKSEDIIEINDKPPSKSLLQKVESYLNRDLSKWQTRHESTELRKISLEKKPSNNNIKINQDPGPVMPSMTMAVNQVEPAEENKKVGFSSFNIGKVLGAGAFGKVYLVKKKDTGKIYAMKALKKRNLIIKKQLRYAVTEANVLKMANHPFILPLNFAFQTPQYLYMVVEFCPGGDLSFQIANKTTLDEETARFYIAELVLAVEALHKLNVIYRDLKPENILIGRDGHIRVADFGLSKEGVGDNDRTMSFCGSPAYLSPEMVKQKGAGKAADIYGIGAVLYEMLVGTSPYYNDDIPKMYKEIQEGNLHIPNSLSPEAKSLIKKLLNKDPKTRIGVIDKNEIKQEPFFKSIDWDKLYKKKFTPPEIPNESDNVNFSAQTRSPLIDHDYEANNIKVNRVIDFSFVRPEPTEDLTEHNGGIEESN